MNRGYFHHDSPDLIGSHWQSSPDLGFRRPFLGVVANPAIPGDRSSEQLTCAKSIAGTGKGVQGMVECTHFFGSQAGDAAIDRRQGHSFPQVCGFQVDEEADRAEGNRLGRGSAEVSEAIFGAIFDLQRGHISSEDAAFSLLAKDDDGGNGDRIVSMVLTSCLEDGADRRHSTGFEFIPQVSTHGQASRDPNFNPVHNCFELGGNFVGIINLARKENRE